MRQKQNEFWVFVLKNTATARREAAHRFTWNAQSIAARIVARAFVARREIHSSNFASPLSCTCSRHLVPHRTAVICASRLLLWYRSGNYSTFKMGDDMAEARAKMIAKRFGGAAPTSTGGKGSMRRKKKVASRSAAAQSDAKLSTTLKKLGATNIPGIEEVNLFKEDGKVIHFVNPKVQASIAANTYIISGPSETKPLQDLLPSIVSQLGMDNLSQLQSMAAQVGAGGAAATPADDDDDDDVPDLVEGNFEEVSEQS